MSRSCQYIGLTKEATEYLKDFYATECKEETHFCDTIISYRTYKPNNENSDIEKVEEVDQEEIWSSGPMIYFCLKVTYKNGTHRKICKWKFGKLLTHEDIQNGALPIEYDRDKGEIYRY